MGRRIQFLRQQRKISQMDLAEVLGISRQYMGFIENDERTPSLDIVIKLAEAFGITVDDLLGRQLNTEEETEMYALLTDCSPEESTILMESMKALKSILHKHKIIR